MILKNGFCDENRRCRSKNLIFATCFFVTSLYCYSPVRASTVNEGQRLNELSSPSTPLSVVMPPSGPIDETMVTCNVEDLEEANDSQLYTILHDLKQTAFFRMFRVDLSHKCPLSSWRSAGSHEEEDFECPSAKKDNLDLDAEPLCTVQPEQPDSQAFPAFLASNALFSLSKEGFQSKEQRETYTWQHHSDEVEAEEDFTAFLNTPADCDQDKVRLPEDFWLDLCTRVRNEDPLVINLLLNPERNTGYNGTHIWKSIYEENCYTVSPKYKDSCLEERFLYRLISGLHASTTISIAKNYYPPSKRKGRTDWEPNPAYFMEKFTSHPDYIRNLHFSYVVLLRALTKASEFLYNYDIRTGDVLEDETATVLLKRLLGSAILKSCASVFSAFDESLMFSSVDELNNDFSLQYSFKDVFFNISSILDCVQCQQCKLHGKLTMLGYGTSLKILFSPANSDFSRILTGNEIVALINTLAKFSESIRHVRELTHLYLLSEQQQQQPWSPAPSPKVQEPETNSLPKPSLPSPAASKLPTPSGAVEGVILSSATLDVAVGAIASLARQGLITSDREAELIQMALSRNPELLILARHYAALDPKKFLKLSQYITNTAVREKPDAIIVGSGLAGMAAALNILDRGGHVILIEKEHLLGGNSNKASSGINACCPDNDGLGSDSIEIFRNDTIRSAGSSVRLDLIDVLVRNSASAVTWLRDRVGVDLSLKAQLGGHSAKRTHRPSNGMAGAEIIYGMQKAVKAYQASGQVTILTDSKVTKLLQKDGRVIGVQYFSMVEGEGSDKSLYSDNVILATGGFAADRSPGSYLSHYRPELLKMPTTAGSFSTGDGISLATLLGAGTVDMDKVQIHPTGWVDPSNPNKSTKILAAELMRGVGGILINSNGDRFCNELGTRAYVTEKMLSHDPHYAKTKTWKVESPIPTFFLVLSSSAAADGKKHVDLYAHKGLMTKLEGVAALAEWMRIPELTIVTTLKKYQNASKSGSDEFGKTAFQGVPANDLKSEVFYAGIVTPVLHYCMGGVTINTAGNVLDEEGKIIPGLYAAGEVTGGVHGVNRLGGNSLLECTVFGTLVGQSIPIQVKQKTYSEIREEQPDESSSSSELRTVSLTELSEHNKPDDCWVAIHGIVYDLTSFAEEHPAGPESIHALAGKDGSKAFAAVHNEGILDEVHEDIVGRLANESS